MQFEKVMRKYVLLALCSLGLLNSCFKDDSTVAKEENRAPAIVVEGLNDTSVVSYSTVLELTPTVLSGKRKLWFILLS